MSRCSPDEAAATPPVIHQEETMETREPKRQKLVIESPSSSSSDEECCFGRPKKQINVCFKIDTISLPKEEAVNSEVISQTIRPHIDFPCESTKRGANDGNTDETKPCPQNVKARELKRSLHVKASISLVKSTVETVFSSSSRKKSEKKGKSNNDDSKVIVDLTACTQRKETFDLTGTSKKPLDLTASNLKYTFDLTGTVSNETMDSTKDSNDEAVIVVNKPLPFASSRKKFTFKIAPKQTIQLRQVTVTESLSLIKPPPTMRPFPTAKPFPRIKLPPARLPFKSPPQARENVARLTPQTAATGYDSDVEYMKQKRDETNECVSLLDDRKPAAVPKDVNAFDNKVVSTQGSKTSHVKSATSTTIDKRKRDETNECISLLDGRKPAAVPKDVNAFDNKVFSTQGGKSSNVKSAKGTTIDHRKRDEMNEFISVLENRKPAAVPKDGNAVDNKVFSTQGRKTSHVKSAKGTTIDKYFSPVRGTIPSVTEPRRSAFDRNFSPKRELPIPFGSGRKRMSIPQAQTSGFGLNNQQQRLLARKPVSSVVDLLLNDFEQDDSSVPNGIRPEEDDFDIARELAKFAQSLDTNQTIEDDFDIEAELAKFPQPLDTNQTIEDDFDIEAELAKFPQPERVGPYTYDEFVVMYNYVQDNLGITFGEVERGSLVKKANNNMDEADTKQRSAMYGEIEPKMAKILLEEYVNLDESKCALDIGHGAGLFGLQLAFTAGCSVRGIEVVESRHFVAEQFKRAFLEKHMAIIRKENKEHSVGNIDFRRGRLEDAKNLQFLTKDVDFAFCNNFCGVFGEKSRQKGQRDGFLLNDYLVGLLTQMKPGAVLITLDILPAGPDRKAVNKHRRRHRMTEKAEASYFELDEFSYANDPRNKHLFSWMTQKVNFTLYRYTRTESVKAMHLCGNPQCPYGHHETPFQAWKTLEDGKVVLNSCECGYKIPVDRVRKHELLIADDF